MTELGVIGGGAMGSALIKGIIKAGLILPDRVYLVEPDFSKLKALENNYKIQPLPGLPELVDTCRTILIAVKPQVLPGILQELKSRVTKNHLLISIAAGVPLAVLENAIPHARFVRAMPNTPAKIGKGVSTYCLGRGTTAVDSELVNSLLQCVGQVLQIPEHLMDAATAVSGSGPAYVYSFIEAFIDAGVMLGLSRDAAVLLVTETVLGSVELLKQTEEHPAKLRNEVTSPAGTTAAALFELDKGAFGAVIKQAVLAAAKRAAELAKPKGDRDV